MAGCNPCEFNLAAEESALQDMFKKMLLDSPAGVELSPKEVAESLANMLAEDAVSNDQENRDAKTLIGFSYKIDPNGEWRGYQEKTLTEMRQDSEKWGYKDDHVLNRTCITRDTFTKDPRAYQSIYVSELTEQNNNRSYIYINNIDRETGKINAFAVEFRGTNEELRSFLAKLQGNGTDPKSISFDTPLFFSKANSVGMDSVYDAIRNSVKNPINESGASDYFVRLQRDLGRDSSKSPVEQQRADTATVYKAMLNFFQGMSVSEMRAAIPALSANLLDIKRAILHEQTSEQFRTFIENNKSNASFVRALEKSLSSDQRREMKLQQSDVPIRYADMDSSLQKQMSTPVRLASNASAIMIAPLASYFSAPKVQIEQKKVTEIRTQNDLNQSENIVKHFNLNALIRGIINSAPEVSAAITSRNVAAATSSSFGYINQSNQRTVPANTGMKHDYKSPYSLDTPNSSRSKSTHFSEGPSSSTKKDFSEAKSGSFLQRSLSGDFGRQDTPPNVNTNKGSILRNATSESRATWVSGYRDSGYHPKFVKKYERHENTKDKERIVDINEVKLKTRNQSKIVKEGHLASKKSKRHVVKFDLKAHVQRESSKQVKQNNEQQNKKQRNKEQVNKKHISSRQATLGTTEKKHSQNKSAGSRLVKFTSKPKRHLHDIDRQEKQRQNRRSRSLKVLSNRKMQLQQRKRNDLLRSSAAHRQAKKIHIMRNKSKNSQMAKSSKKTRENLRLKLQSRLSKSLAVARMRKCMYSSIRLRQNLKLVNRSRSRDRNQQRSSFRNYTKRRAHNEFSLKSRSATRLKKIKLGLEYSLHPVLSQSQRHLRYRLILRNLRRLSVSSGGASGTKKKRARNDKFERKLKIRIMQLFQKRALNVHLQRRIFDLMLEMTKSGKARREMRKIFYHELSLPLLHT